MAEEEDPASISVCSDGSAAGDRIRARVVFGAPIFFSFLIFSSIDGRRLSGEFVPCYSLSIDSISIIILIQFYTIGDSLY